MVMFCVLRGRLLAAPRKHRMRTVMCKTAREGGIGMPDDMNDIGGRARQWSWKSGTVWWKSWRKQD